MKMYFPLKMRIFQPATLVLPATIFRSLTEPCGDGLQLGGIETCLPPAIECVIPKRTANHWSLATSRVVVLVVVALAAVVVLRIASGSGSGCRRHSSSSSSSSRSRSGRGTGREQFLDYFLDNSLSCVSDDGTGNRILTFMIKFGSIPMTKTLQWSNVLSPGPVLVVKGLECCPVLVINGVIIYNPYKWPCKTGVMSPLENQACKLCSLTSTGTGGLSFSFPGRLYESAWTEFGLSKEWRERQASHLKA